MSPTTFLLWAGGIGTGLILLLLFIGWWQDDPSTTGWHEDEGDYDPYAGEQR